MLSRVNSMVWMDGTNGGDEQTASWPPQNNNNNNDNDNNNSGSAPLANNQDMEISTFKSMLEAENEDWYMTNGGGGNADISFSPSFTEAAAVNSQLMVDSSASCSPTSASVFNNASHQLNYFINPKPLIQNNNSFDLGCESGYLESALNNHRILNCNGFSDLQPQGQGAMFGVGGEGSNSPFLFNRSKILKPLGSMGSQPTLFQKRAALRKNLGNNLGCLSLDRNNHVVIGSGEVYEDMKRKGSSGDDVEDLSIDGSNFNYDSDDQFLESSGVSKGEMESVKHDGKGKKKGLPAKNLMAERRRRKKLNDRLYMLRSVVPKISKVRNEILYTS